MVASVPRPPAPIQQQVKYVIVGMQAGWCVTLICSERKTNNGKKCSTP